MGLLLDLLFLPVKLVFKVIFAVIQLVMGVLGIVLIGFLVFWLVMFPQMKEQQSWNKEPTTKKIKVIKKKPIRKHVENFNR